MPEVGLRKIFTSVRSSYLPALFLAFGIWGEFWFGPILGEDAHLLHRLFYASAVICFIFSIIADKSKLTFALLWIVGAYFYLNRLNLLTSDGAFDWSWLIMMLMLPANFLFLSYSNPCKLFCRRNFVYLCIMLLQAMILERVAAIGFLSALPEVCPFVVAALWFGAILMLFITVVHQGGMGKSAMVYAMLVLFLALMPVERGKMPVLYFLTAVLILFSNTFFEYVYGQFRDVLTGVCSKKCYLWHSKKSFPLKYSLGVIFIDNYEKLLQAFGKSNIDKLTWMIVEKIKQLQDRALIYRIDEDEFILIFGNEDKKKSFEYLETVRRSVAGSVFELNSRDKIKVTISAGVSEKKRSDIDASAVLTRTREAVQKAYKFTQNMTSSV